MKEARLVVPKKDNDGGDLRDLHYELQERLSDTFGGYTAIDAFGGWTGHNGALYHESVVAYDVAVSNSGLGQLTDIAHWIRDEARQQSVYLRFPSGEVTFVQ